jgi:hypothetical protein
MYICVFGSAGGGGGGGLDILGWVFTRIISEGFGHFYGRQVRNLGIRVLRVRVHYGDERLSFLDWGIYF